MGLPNCLIRNYSRSPERKLCSLCNKLNLSLARRLEIGLVLFSRGRRGGLMVSALDSGASAPGSSPGLGHCVVFLGKKLYSHSASLHPGV